ncbi:hypothetical protein [Carboxylicivirga sp. RSCT41]|uniref:hypothetical protein n=1 Tax=Carboxylicivirga agarovorans TaxID=3417570 RepID=UPI003D32FD41
MEKWNTIKIELDTDGNETRRYPWRKCNVDSKGNPLEEIELDCEGNIICKRFYRYFEDETIEVYIEYDAFEELVERHHYTKNESGETVKVVLEYENGLKITKDYSYTDLGNSYKAVVRNEDGEVTGYEVYVQNEEGQTIEEIELDENNNELIKFQKSYGGNGDLKIEKEYRDGNLYQGERHEYDANGNVTKTTLRNYIDNYEVVEIYEYDRNNNLIRNSSHQDGMLVFENHRSYDANSKLKFEKVFQMDIWDGSILTNIHLIHEWQN